MPAIASAAAISIRLARADEFDALIEIEIDATHSLVEAGVTTFANGPQPIPRPQLEASLAAGLLIVAVDPEDRPVGFVAGHEHDGGLYVGELDVVRSWQRRGIGRALMAAALAEARRRRLWGAMLTTERLVRFNAPFYASLGFSEPNADAMPPFLARQLAEEVAEIGDSRRRLAMVLRFTTMR